MDAFQQNFSLRIDDGFAVTDVILRGKSPATVQTLIDAMVAGTGLTVEFQNTTILAESAKAAGSPPTEPR